MGNMLHAISAEGERLFADFSLQVTDEGFDLTMESRSGVARGGPPPRNRDYERLMSLIFRRAAAMEADLTGAWVVSRKTTELSAAERLLRADAFPYPVHLPTVVDLEALRMRLSATQGAIGREPGARGPGNRNKRVLLSFRLPQRLSADQLEAAIVNGELPPTLAQLPGIAPSTHKAIAVDSLGLRALQAILDRYAHATPRVRQGVQKQIERGPIGDMVKALNGHRCQVCLALGHSGEGFRKPDGRRYVEAHHVEGVASGAQGVLRAGNVITVCAGHHRELHYGAVSEVLDLGDQFQITVEAGSVLIAKTLHEVAGRSVQIA